ncbi:phosphotransacetylase family protein [Pseudanabaena yagii]|uniref:Phosphotransacetylase family protein n=1 Tax=Pseudanabaena yagii GIHE-NHR1 TaxID=2722753 RepID=A0ABX1LY89_9CYAN|nr:phosphotransacetylase family protein [Pseudanabaena yagii]NMF60331.1 phosphotransacetylase family protein [Pseudanabaena yagii GIHE-NHR1]
MPQAKHLLIGSTRAGSGKSATILGLTYHLQAKGYKVGYGKPIGTFTTKELPESAEHSEADVDFIQKTLNLPSSLLRPTLLNLDRAALQRRLSGEDKADYSTKLEEYKKIIEGDLVLLEAPANTAEGTIFGLSLEQMANNLDAPILLVMRFGSLLVVDHILMAKNRFGDRLLGVVINDIPDDQYETAIEILHPYLEEQGIPVFALMPENRTLRSVSVSELIDQLGATILSCPENIDLSKVMVEELKIGAMDVNSAQSYFRKSYNKAVITGSSRIDLQFAALETSTNCLILTGRPYISDDVAHKAMELGVPVLSVSKDTLSTVSIIESCLGQVRLHEGIKVTSICEMMGKHFNFERFLKLMKIKALATA